MILITTALMMEARPLVRRLGLSATGNGPFRVFANGDYVLLVTGTGGYRAASATGWAQARFPGIRAVFNIGFCGAAPEVAPLHAWRLVHSIRDQGTGRLSVPDILWKHGFTECGLLTVPRVMKRPDEHERLVDMEGCGVYEAARLFLSPDRIVLLKWVSDSLTGKIDVEETETAYAAALDPVIEALHHWSAEKESGESRLPEEWYVAITKRVRLSESQSVYLKKWLSGHAARGGALEPLLKGLPDSIPSSKRENNQCFERLKDALKG